MKLFVRYSELAGQAPSSSAHRTHGGPLLRGVQGTAFLRLAAPIAVLIALPVALFSEPSPPVLRPSSASQGILVHNDVSGPLREVSPPPVEEKAIKVPHPVKRIPRPKRPLGRTAKPKARLLKPQSTAQTKLVIDLLSQFDGVGRGLKPVAYPVDGAPSDVNGAAGITQYVAWANEAFAVFDKQGKTLYGPALGKTIWHGFGGPCEDRNDGDPIVKYDRRANRWVMAQFAVPKGGPYYQCIAVSTTDDALGSYARYSYEFADFNDYPKIGIWPDGYYVTFNMFRNEETFIGSQVCVMERAAMLQGRPARIQCVAVPSEGGFLPADLDGALDPPARAPNYLVNLGDNSLKVWSYSVDWANMNKSRLVGPTRVPVGVFEVACPEVDPCIPQKGTDQKLDSLSDRLMYRLAYRNFGAYRSALVNHAVDVGGAAGIRWYELRDLETQHPRVVQQGTYLGDGKHRWIGSIAQDRLGNIALGYNVSSGSQYPSIALTGRAAGGNDPPGTLAQETIIAVGNGSQSLNRWGDYSSLSVDPSDDCTFWFTTQYIDKPGDYVWHTLVASFKLGNCSAQ